MYQVIKRYRSLITSLVILAFALVGLGFGVLELENGHLQKSLFIMWIAFAFGGLAFEPKVFLLSISRFVSSESRSKYPPILYSVSALFFMLWGCSTWYQ